MNEQEQINESAKVCMTIVKEIENLIEMISSAVDKIPNGMLRQKAIMMSLYVMLNQTMDVLIAVMEKDSPAIFAEAILAVKRVLNKHKGE